MLKYVNKNTLFINYDYSHFLIEFEKIERFNMNISSVSFGSQRQVHHNYKNRPIQAQSHRSVQRPVSRPVYDDKFVSNNKKPQKKKQVLIPTPLKTFILGVVLTGGLNSCLSHNADNVKPVVIPFDSTNTSISDIADIYDINEEAILAYNNVEEESELENNEEIRIPAAYDALNDKIEELKKELYSSKLSDKKRQNIEDSISDLEHTKFIQNSIASAYTDGKMVYFTILEPSEDLPEEISEIYNGSINVENFKDLFNIKDKAIREHNDIGFNYEYNGYDGHAYKDYTGTYLYAGDVIKVPLSAIKD